MRVHAAHPKDFAWLVERIGCVLSASARAIKAVDATGRIWGMVAYDGWTHTSAQCHMAVDAPIAWRHLVRPAFHYPFEEAQRRLLIGLVAANNPKSLRMTQHLGFRRTHTFREGFREGVDLVVFEMTREECRWLSSTENRKAAA